MDEHSIASDESTLFQVEGQADEIDVLMMTEELGPGATKGGEADLTLPFRAKSHFSIGDPIVSLLTAVPGMPTSMQQQLADYEFYQIQLACSFQAAPACRFVDARFSLELKTLPDGPQGQSTSPVENAIAYDLFPLRIEDEHTVTVTRKLSPEIKFGYEQASATLTLPLLDRVEQRIVYTSRVEAYDLQGTRPAWSFYRTEEREISGPQRLFLLLRKPKGTSVKATFRLAARVQFVVGGQSFGPADLVMVFRRRDRSKTLIDEPTIPLC